MRNSIYSLILSAIFSLTSASISFAEDKDTNAESTEQPTVKEEIEGNNLTEEGYSNYEATKECEPISAEENTDVKIETDGDTSDKTGTDLKVTDVWARASIASSKNSSAYFKINNPTDKEIVIIAANAPGIANNVELHNSFVDEKGISRMSTIDKVVVPSNSDIEFKPGGMHVMLFDLKGNLKAGEKFTLNLIIENGEPIEIEGEIRD